MTTVFVYGTLMPGRLRWPVIADHVAAARPATVPGTLYDTGHGYPALVAGGTGTVHGVVLELVPEQAAVAVELLDEVEGPDYHRVAATTTEGEVVQTYVWRAGLLGMEPIPSGRWAAIAER